ncbi:hypothetical protein V5799_013802 [Amblyomma americanum]|uniref:Uncharacterized protein n=1 Tax=Amblyomma americanum TaxID=6943 RepID=A0AAQ4E4X6_AMBAM
MFVAGAHCPFIEYKLRKDLVGTSEESNRHRDVEHGHSRRPAVCGRLLFLYASKWRTSFSTAVFSGSTPSSSWQFTLLARTWAKTLAETSLSAVPETTRSVPQVCKQHLCGGYLLEAESWTSLHEGLCKRVLL